MNKLVSLNQTIVVPINDEALETSYEMQMSLEEFFKKFFDGFMPDIVEAVPVQWLKDLEMDNDGKLGKAAGKVLKAWKKEEA
jgi:hypothetical protein